MLPTSKESPWAGTQDGGREGRDGTGRHVEGDETDA